MTEQNKGPDSGAGGSGTSPAGGSGGPPKAPNLEALKARLGLNQQPGAAGPVRPAGGPAAGPAQPSASSQGVPAAQAPQAPVRKAEASDAFQFAGGDVRGGQRELTDRELEAIEREMTKPKRGIGTIITYTAIVVVGVIIAMFLGLQFGKGMSARTMNNDGIAQAKKVLAKLQEPITRDGQEGAEGATTKLDYLASFKASIDSFLTQRNERHQAWMDALSQGQLPPDFSMEVLEADLKELDRLIAEFEENVGTFDPAQVLGKDVYSTELAAVVTNYSNKIDVIKGGVERLKMAIMIIRGLRITPPLPEAYKGGDTLVYLLAPHVDRADGKLVRAEIVKPEAKLSEDGNTFKDLKADKKVEKRVTCDATQLTVQVKLPSCDPKIPETVQEIPVDSFVPGEIEAVKDVPWLNVSDPSGKSEKKAKVDLASVFSLDTVPIIEPLEKLVIAAQERLALEKSALDMQVASLVAYYVNTATALREAMGPVDWDNFLKSVEALANQEELFTL